MICLTIDYFSFAVLFVFKESKKMLPHYFFPDLGKDNIVFG